MASLSEEEIAKYTSNYLYQPRFECRICAQIIETQVVFDWSYIDTHYSPDSYDLYQTNDFSDLAEEEGLWRMFTQNADGKALIAKLLKDNKEVIGKYHCPNCQITVMRRPFPKKVFSLKLTIPPTNKGGYYWLNVLFSDQDRLMVNVRRIWSFDAGMGRIGRQVLLKEGYLTRIYVEKMNLLTALKRSLDRISVWGGKESYDLSNVSLSIELPNNKRLKEFHLDDVHLLNLKDLYGDPWEKLKISEEISIEKEEFKNFEGMISDDDEESPVIINDSNILEVTDDLAAVEEDDVKSKSIVYVDEPYNPNDCIYIQCRKGWINRWLREHPDYDPRGQADTWGGEEYLRDGRLRYENELIRGAATWGLTDLVKRCLLDYRVDPSARVNEALREASRRGHHAVVELLLEAGVRDTNDWALISAFRNQDQRMVDLLTRSWDRVKKRAIPTINYGIHDFAGHIKIDLVDRELADPVYRPKMVDQLKKEEIDLIIAYCDRNFIKCDFHQYGHQIGFQSELTIGTVGNFTIVTLIGHGKTRSESKEKVFLDGKNYLIQNFGYPNGYAITGKSPATLANEADRRKDYVRPLKSTKKETIAKKEKVVEKIKKNVPKMETITVGRRTYPVDYYRWLMTQTPAVQAGMTGLCEICRNAKAVRTEYLNEKSCGTSYCQDCLIQKMELMSGGDKVLKLRASAQGWKLIDLNQGREMGGLEHKFIVLKSYHIDNGEVAARWSVEIYTQDRNDTEGKFNLSSQRLPIMMIDGGLTKAILAENKMVEIVDQNNYWADRQFSGGKLLAFQMDDFDPNRFVKHLEEYYLEKASFTRLEMERMNTQEVIDLIYDNPYLKWSIGPLTRQGRPVQASVFRRKLALLELNRRLDPMLTWPVCQHLIKGREIKKNPVSNFEALHDLAIIIAAKNQKAYEFICQKIKERNRWSGRKEEDSDHQEEDKDSTKI